MNGPVPIGLVLSSSGSIPSGTIHASSMMIARNELLGCVRCTTTVWSSTIAT